MTMQRFARKALAVVLWPITALTGYGQMLPAGMDPHDEVFYQFMPITWRCSAERAAKASELNASGAVDAPIEVKYRFGDFKGMTESLDYLAGLGITAVWMTPIYPSRAYHGYQHGAADRVNPWLGEEADFTAFVKAAHAKNIKVFIDLVAYGISQDSTWFKEALAGDAHDDASWLAVTRDEKTLRPGPVWRDKAHPGRAFQGYDFKTWTGETIGIAWWDLRKQEPRDLVISWCRKWMDPNGDGDVSDGVDGFRLDHVWGTYQSGPNGWGYNVKDFWIPWKKALREVNPKVFTFAEQAKWETNGEDLLPAHDAALAKGVLFAIRESIVGGTAAKAAEATLAALKSIPEGRTLMGSVGDHDVDRIASSLGGDETDNLDRAKLAAAALLVLPLPPIIYAGDEIGMLGRAGNFGSDANDIPRREPFKWTARDAAGEPGSPMTDYWRISPRVIEKRYSKDHDGRSVEEQQGKAGSLLETYRELIRVRRESVALRRGDYMPIALEKGEGSESVWCFARVHECERVLVAINFSRRAQTVTFSRKESWGGASLGPWKTAAKVVDENGVHKVTVPALGVAVVKVER